MNKYKYGIETLSQVKDEIEPLLKLDYEEMFKYKDTIPLDVDWNGYESLEKVEMLRIYTAREQDSQTLVGYFVVVQSPSLHHREDIFVVNDVIYVEPEARNKGVGASLIQFVEDDLKSLGVSLFTIHVNSDTKVGKLLDKLGYTEQETVFMKCFKDHKED